MATTLARRPRHATQQKLDHLLASAAALIATKGFEATAIRDVGRKVDASLAGMYYYFASKEDLLYQIQSTTFSSLVAAQEAAAGLPGAAEDRLRRLILGHLIFYAKHPNEMKVCTYELESLTGDLYRQVAATRKRYFRIVAGVVGELIGGPARKTREAKSRRIALYIFGMLNWVFMWYDPAKDGPVDHIGAEMFNLLMSGIPRR
jgi:TetR/AcrR family transcriptional regulator